VAVKRLLLLRHGRTTWNAVQRIQGQLDAPLDETGHAQAAAVAPLLAAERPVLLWSSDLSRAADTAAYVGEACGLDVLRDRRLRERHFGDLQGSTYADWRERAPEQHAAFRAGDPNAVPGGEKVSEVSDRITTALRELLDASPAGETALAVAHGLALKYAVVGLLGWEIEAAAALRGMDNCGWAEMHVDERGRVALAAYNRTA
jgi:probable phosphoglycerate mutase